MQVEVTVRITGDELQVGAFVSEMFARGSQHRLQEVPHSAFQTRERDLRGIVEAMRDQMTELAREALREIAEQCLLNGAGRAYSRRVRSKLGDISPAAFAGRLGPVTAFARRHNFWPFTRRWTGTEMEYQMDPEVATLVLELFGR